MLTLILVLAGLMGAAGVALGAAAAHGQPGSGLDSASHMLLFHAAAVLGGAALVHQAMLARTVGLIALFAFVVGAALFAGDITARAYLGHRLFPMAAPTGGTILIAGWLVLAVAALIGK